MSKRAITFVLNDERDLDLLTWLDGLTNKSAGIREAIRAYIQIQSGESQEAAIREAVAQATAHLPVVVAEAVREALAVYRLAPMQEQPFSGEEDPEQAARLEAQLDDFFGD